MLLLIIINPFITIPIELRQILHFVSRSQPPRDGTLRFGQQSCVEAQQILRCTLL